MRTRPALLGAGRVLLVLFVVVGQLLFHSFSELPTASTDGTTTMEQAEAVQNSTEVSLPTRSTTPSVIDITGARPKTLANLQPTPGLVAVLRLIDAGVAESTLLAFVTNS